MPDNNPQTNAGPAEPVIPVVRMSMEEALDKINLLEASRKAAEAELEKVKKERDQGNSVLSAQVRAAYLQKARSLTSIPETQLHKMGNDELETVVKLAEQMKRPNPKSIMFQADTNESDLIDLYSERFKRRE
jgi:hypothetical protein